MRSSKKGNIILDTLVVMIFVGLFIFFAVLAYNPLKSVNDMINLDSDWNNTDAKAELNMQTANYPTFFDNLAVFVFLLVWIVAIISSLFIETNPAFFFVSLFIIICLLVAATFLSNGLSTMAADSNLYLSSFPKISWMLNNLLLLIMVIVASIGISLAVGAKQ